MLAGERGGWKRRMLTVAGVEERELKLEAVLLQALEKPILRVPREGVKRHGLCRAMPGARGWLRGAALSMVVTRLRSFARGCPGRLRVENSERRSHELLAQAPV